MILSIDTKLNMQTLTIKDFCEGLKLIQIINISQLLPLSSFHPDKIKKFLNITTQSALRCYFKYKFSKEDHCINRCTIKVLCCYPLDKLEIFWKQFLVSVYLNDTHSRLQIELQLNRPNLFASDARKIVSERTKRQK